MKREANPGEFEFGIYEVYYDENGKVKGCTQDSMVPICSSENDLLFEMDLMKKAFKKETLIYKENKPL